MSAERELRGLSPALLDELVELVADRIADRLAPRLADELAARRLASAQPGAGTSALLTLDELVAELPSGKRPETWKRWLYERLRQGEKDATRKVPGAVKLGGSWFFEPEQARAWIANGASS